MRCALVMFVLPVLRRMFTASRGKEGERGYRLSMRGLYAVVAERGAGMMNKL